MSFKGLDLTGSSKGTQNPPKPSLLGIYCNEIILALE